MVDDGSTDNTYEVVSLKKRVIVLRHITNLGQGAALETGFKYCRQAGADIVVTFDADGQFNPKEIKKVIRPIKENKADIALGSRFIGRTYNMPFIKKIVLKLGVLFTNLFSNIDLTDTHNGFRALNKRALKKIRIKHYDMDHASDIIHQIKQQKLRYQEVPVSVYYDRYHKIKGQRINNSINIIFNLIFDRMIK